jgi:hypothetical protein
MALYAFDRRNAALDAAWVRDYMLTKLVEFASLAMLTPVDVRGDGSCALHAFQAGVLRTGTSELQDQAAMKAADITASRFIAGVRDFFKQLAAPHNDEVAKVFGRKSEFLNDFALAYLAQVFNVRIRFFWIFFPKEKNFELAWQEQFIGPLNAQQVITMAFMDEHYYYLQPQEEAHRGYIIVKTLQDIYRIEQIGYVTFYNLLWREFQPDSYTSRGQIFRSVEEWLLALQNDGIPCLRDTSVLHRSLRGSLTSRSSRSTRHYKLRTTTTRRS